MKDIVNVCISLWGHSIHISATIPIINVLDSIVFHGSMCAIRGLTVLVDLMKETVTDRSAFTQGNLGAGVALENVCDGVDDCPLQEDEYFCDTFPSKCLLNCTCLLFVIECIGWQPLASQYDLRARFTYPYVKISIRDFNISDILRFIQQFHQAVEFKLHNSNIYDICKKWDQFRGTVLLRSLSLSYTNVTALLHNCFSKIQLRFLNLSFNYIAYMAKYSFRNTEQLLILDLSSNRISHLFANTFSAKVSIKLLDLCENLIIKVSPDFFKGAIIFYRKGGPSVCDRRSPIFSGPPLCLRQKILVPPLTTPKNSGPPPQTDGPPLPVINDSSLMSLELIPFQPRVL